jgi:hypothetical protein
MLFILGLCFFLGALWWELVSMWGKIFILLAIGVILGLALSCNLPKIIKFRHDAPLEELFEDMIENYSGIDADITPNSPEHA